MTASITTLLASADGRFLKCLKSERRASENNHLQLEPERQRRQSAQSSAASRSSTAVAKIQQGSAWWFNDHKTGMTGSDDLSRQPWKPVRQLRGNADRLQKLLILHPSRLLPQHSLQSDRQLGRERRVSRQITKTLGGDCKGHHATTMQSTTSGLT